MSTQRLFLIVCDGCGRRCGQPYPTAAEGRRLAKALGWLSIPSNGAARGNYTERQDRCPDCQAES